jgi:hypothetical protein
VFGSLRANFNKGLKIAQSIEGCKPKAVAFFYMISSTERQRAFEENVKVVNILNKKTP